MRKSNHQGEQAECANCDSRLFHIDGEPRDPCEKCGSTARRFFREIDASVQVRSGLAAKAKHATAIGKRKYHWESTDHWQHNRDRGELVNVQRIIDRENDRYAETIRTKDGEVIRIVEEPLSSHRGRGDAAPKGR